MAFPRTLAISSVPLSWFFGLALAGAAVATPLASSADPQTEARYPFDPACPWGRISNGKGMLHRCISETEAAKLMAEAKAPLSGQQAASTPVSAASQSNPAASTNATASANAAPSTNAAPPAGETPGSTSGTVVVKLGTLAPEKGELTAGKLGKPLDRYAACVEDNGGLSAASGTVTLQFLVRAELGRAEGVEVQKFTGVSKKAARCIADVVDRRQVGAPTVPLTGATLTFEISPSK